MYESMYECMFVFVFMYVCMHACMHACMCVYDYILRVDVTESEREIKKLVNSQT